VLVGLVTMRDLLLQPKSAKLEEFMIAKPFALVADTPLMDAMKTTLNKHFPTYPVCDHAGKLLGTVRGSDLFERQAFEISAQAGSMVGVDKEEHVATPWSRSFRFRHPWLLVNLATASLAASVVGSFQDSIDKIIVLAVFLPLIAGQSGNTGCQSLAVALRGMTLGELKPGRTSMLAWKETVLGATNGFVVGVLAGIGMYIFATQQQSAEPPLVLGIIVCTAMTIACTASSIAGVLVPVILKRCGADPSVASAIFLTTMNDIVAMGCFLGLATFWLL
jgi:magnesium transporter